MKIIIFILVLVTFNNTNPERPAEVAVKENVEQSRILTGEITKEDLTKPPHARWFDPMYQSYSPNPEQLETIKKHIGDYKIRAIMGTWCADSQREIPKLFKILELANFDMAKLQLEGVTRRKMLPNDEQKKLDVHRVPTIIFYKDGQEVGRFVEYPQESFEEDIARIVSEQNYRHSYQ